MRTLKLREQDKSTTLSWKNILFLSIENIGQLFAHTRTHACTRTHTHTRTHTLKETSPKLWPCQPNIAYLCLRNTTQDRPSLINTFIFIRLSFTDTRSVRWSWRERRLNVRFSVSYTACRLASVHQSSRLPFFINVFPSSNTLVSLGLTGQNTPVGLCSLIARQPQ